MTNFSAVQAHFAKLRCAHCRAAYAPEGVKLLRTEEDYWVVRIHCTQCEQPAGIAIVGAEVGELPEPRPARSRRPSRRAHDRRAERDRFEGLGPITADEVLDAHLFLDRLGADWATHLPRR